MAEVLKKVTRQEHGASYADLSLGLNAISKAVLQ